VEGEAYWQTLEAEGALSYEWSVTEGTLPPGLTLNSATGVISGTPSLRGEYRFSVQLETSGQIHGRDFSITVAAGDLGVGFGDDQFILIEAGSFQMGSTNGDLDEQPVHTVNITKAFRLQKTEVTQRQWTAVMGYNPSAIASCGELCPVDNVSWNDIQNFLVALNATYPEANFRLPTEAEWEYAARAGSTGDYGGTGNLDEMGWYAENSGTKTHFVGLKQPNAWGLLDMHGNAYEWVQDLYSATYYSVSPTDDPSGPLTGSRRVLRGGSEDQNAGHARAANREDRSPTFKSYIIVGFRLARDQ
jgi:formylglycine-generating enzyme required for sulfatase activity